MTETKPMTVDELALDEDNLEENAINNLKEAIKIIKKKGHLGLSLLYIKSAREEISYIVDRDFEKYRL